MNKDIYEIVEVLKMLDDGSEYKVINSDAGDLFFNSGFNLKKIAESVIDYGIFDRNNDIETFKSKLRTDLDI